MWNELIRNLNRIVTADVDHNVIVTADRLGRHLAAIGYPPPLRAYGTGSNTIIFEWRSNATYWEYEIFAPDDICYMHRDSRGHYRHLTFNSISDCGAFYGCE